MNNLRDIFTVIFCYAMALCAVVSCAKGDDPQPSDDEEVVYLQLHTDGIEDAVDTQADAVHTKGALVDGGYRQPIDFKWDHMQDMLMTIHNSDGELVKFKDTSNKVARYSTVSVDAGGSQSKSATLNPTYGIAKSSFETIDASSRAFLLSPVKDDDVVEAVNKYMDVKIAMPKSPMTVKINSADHLKDYLYVYSSDKVGEGSFAQQKYTFSSNFQFTIIPAIFRIYVYNTTGYKLKFDQIRIALTQGTVNQRDPNAPNDFYPLEAILRTRVGDDAWTVNYANDVQRYTNVYINTKDANGSQPVMENNSYFTTYMLMLPDVRNHLVGNSLRFRARFVDADGGISPYKAVVALACNNFKKMGSNSGNSNPESGYYYDIHMNITPAVFAGLEDQFAIQ